MPTTPSIDSPRAAESQHENGLKISSPDGKIVVSFQLVKGVPRYRVTRAGKEVVKPSRLGFTFQNAHPMDGNLMIDSSELNHFDETWIQPWGEAKEIRNNYNELRVILREAGGASRRMDVIFRVYDDGIGFRYEFPAQEGFTDSIITEEKTEFTLAGDCQAWWIPAYMPQRYEYLYRKTPLDSLRTEAIRALHTPLTIECDDGLFMSIHEANLTDYASMTLKVTGDNTLLCDLTPWSDGTKVKTSAPFRTPWRTIQIGETAGDLITSYLILNLNEPNKLGDISWVRPQKFIGIWWGMHIGKFTWGAGEKHGATTENAKKYIDFAAKHGFDSVLVEGWNKGWDGSWMHNGGQFSFTIPYDDFDIEEVSAYAASRGVKLIGHHETVAEVSDYEQQLEAAFQFARKSGIDTVKTGYVSSDPGIVRLDEDGRTIGNEWHHGQYMVRHYQKVVETAARYHIMLDVHEPVKDTGLRRTYPNMMTREGARGQEYNAWSEDGGNPPEHTTILPFTRLLAGPMDFTPGIFDLLFEKERPDNRVNTTLAHQLALYIVLYSPLQMVADLPENYEGHPAFQFILDVPVDWEQTKVLHAQIGDFVTIARKDRNSEDWYLGSVTDEDGRTLEATLSFLKPDKKYVAEIYADAAEADWINNPEAVEIYGALVNRETLFRIRLAPGGGQAIRIRPASSADLDLFPPYEY